ncbi:MAG: class I SAM-dependent methyltransferase [Ktedonobacterales bacterium]|nr:class I SAM-dependent methyltransferase [Ktedonobacterales bacterium]
MTSSTPQTPVHVINYDAGGYDYRDFWQGRDYEQWAEVHVIRRILRRTTPVQWAVDLGGGFGRNVPLELERAQHVVLMDYSWTNLQNAEHNLLADGQNTGRVFLVRGNIYHLPFRDASFELGSTIRVLHHLAATNDAIAEMSRVIGQHWLLDVPIKHHLLARMKAAVRGKGSALRTRDANELGNKDEPFWNYHLGAIRDEVRAQGWSDSLVASVANFRRWERAVPRPLRGPVRPLVYGAERLAQPMGRGWWGPAQFLWLTKRQQQAFADSESVLGTPPAAVAALAPRLWCPSCHGNLTWTDASATCTACAKPFTRQGMIWDFVVE